MDIREAHKTNIKALTGREIEREDGHMQSDNVINGLFG